MSNPGPASDDETSAMQEAVNAARPFKGPGSEGRIYRMQARHAKAAMAETASELRGNLKALVDPRPVMRKRPLATLVAAAAGGLAAGMALAPSPTKKFHRRLDALAEAIRRPPSTAKPVSSRKRKTLIGRILKIAWRLGRGPILNIALGSLSSAAVNAQSGQPTGDATEAKKPATDGVNPTNGGPHGEKMPDVT